MNLRTGLARLLPADRRTIKRSIAASVLQAAFGLIAIWQVTHTVEPGVTVALLGLYTLALIANFWLRSTNAPRLAAAIFDRLGALRTTLFDAIQHSRLRTVERADDLDLRITRDASALDAFPLALIDTMRFGLVLALNSLMILAVSGIGFVVWVVVVALGTRGLLTWRVQAKADAERSSSEAAALDRTIGELLDGFAQARLDPAIGRSLVDEIEARLETSGTARADSAAHVRNTWLSLQSIMFCGTGVLMFIIPAHSLTHDVEGLNAAVLLFYLSIKQAHLFLNGIFGLTTADEAHERLRATEDALAAERAPATRVMSGEDAGDRGHFESVGVRNASFTYDEDDREAARLGPFDLEIKRGELVFIVGGNGSGKTTLMKLLTGLYSPTTGALTLDGRPTSAGDPRRRDLFTVLFIDQHIFRALYGIDARSEDVDPLLEQFDLTEVTDYRDGRFSRLDLSSGQRKRLSMIIAMLEQRPIMILDEWAAHQDPELRHTYYHTLLPALREAGRTIVAVSHDARYFHLADRIIRLGDTTGPAVDDPIGERTGAR